ncbi:MAG: Rpn family recombination-promoting nuclease/putative transposase [Gammaproteobacteria bacterium]|nr:Rpn family recombination-promoting nuclease/putative transposase [Gammaproteobacteria bacterium]
MEHDAAWKRLFGLPILVEHLLRGFVAQAAGWLDFRSLQKLSASWAGADRQQRHGDAAWRVNYCKRKPGRSLVLLLEFQSTVDKSMASRVLRYAGMAHDELRRQGALDADRELRLLPVVVYSGAPVWSAPGGATGISVSDDGELMLPLPYSYLSLDVRRLEQHHLPSRNIVSTVFKLDALETSEKVVLQMRDLSDWLPKEVGSARANIVFSAILEWLVSMAPKRHPDSGTALAVAKLQREVRDREKSMALLAERMKQWEADWLQQGIEQGIEQGINQGIEQGINQGIDRGLAQERELLRRQAELKFDAATAEELARRLAAVTDAARLTEVGCRIIDCGTGAELLARTDSS